MITSARWRFGFSSFAETGNEPGEFDLVATRQIDFYCSVGTN